jgi:hypothetical protein
VCAFWCCRTVGTWACLWGWRVVEQQEDGAGEPLCVQRSGNYPREQRSGTVEYPGAGQWECWPMSWADFSVCCFSLCGFEKSSASLLTDYGTSWVSSGAPSFLLLWDCWASGLRGYQQSALLPWTPVVIFFYRVSWFLPDSDCSPPTYTSHIMHATVPVFFVVIELAWACLKPQFPW